MPVAPSGLFSLRVPVHFTHTDPAGFVFFPRFFEMYQETLEDWFTHALGLRYADLVQERRLGTPVATIQSTFMRPCKLGDEIEITVRVLHVGNSSFRLRYRGFVDGELRLEAISTGVMISLEDGRPRPIPPDIRPLMERYMAIPD